ncbi:hypothetical protein JCM1841_005025 [Sporobolomyces salmonicolor]
MADDRFTYVNVSHSLTAHLLDEEDDRLGWDLPDDDIQVPAHLLPPYQDEDDETMLPSQTHPSYPYGNPSKPPPWTAPSARGASSAAPAPALAPSTPFAPAAPTAASLRTTLAALELPALFAQTTFGERSDRTWRELALAALFGRRTRPERDEDEDERDAVHTAHGDAGPPAGQNAADDGEGEGEGDGMDGERGSDAGDDEGEGGGEGGTEGRRNRDGTGGA